MNRYEFYSNLQAYNDHQSELKHYGIAGQKWGTRRWQFADGRFNSEGKIRYFGESKRKPKANPNGTVFVSGSSKTQSEDNEFYRGELPEAIKNEIRKYMDSGKTILVGDAPGIDRQVQDFLKDNNYNDVEIYGPGTEIRYSANPKWKTNLVDVPGAEKGSGEWLRGKDEAMTNRATEGLAIVIEDGAQATRNNIARLEDQNKNCNVFQLNKNGKDEWTKKVDYDDILEHVYNNRFDDYKKLSTEEQNKLIDSIKQIRKDYENGKNLSDIQNDSPFDERKVLYAIDDLRRSKNGIIENPDPKTVNERKYNNEAQIKNFLNEQDELFKEYKKPLYKKEFKNNKELMNEMINGAKTINKLTEDLIRDDQDSYNAHLKEFTDKYGYDSDKIKDIQQTANIEYNIYKNKRGPLFYNNTIENKFIGLTKDEWSKLNENEKQGYEFAKHYEDDKNWKCISTHGTLKYNKKAKENEIPLIVEYDYGDHLTNSGLDSTQIYKSYDKYINEFENKIQSVTNKIEKELKQKGYISENDKITTSNVFLSNTAFNNNGFMPELNLDINDGEYDIGVLIDPKTLKIEDIG